LFDMHHGLANAIMISHGMEFNREVCEEKLVRLQSLCQLPGKGWADFVKYLKDFNAQIKLPYTLAGNIPRWDEKTLLNLVDLAEQDPCHQCNPRKVERQNFKEIYEKAYHA
jgi:alcohol dehydrogenase class IV